MSKCKFCDHVNPSDDELCKSCGAPLPASQQSTSDEVRSLIAEGKKIAAVKLYREQTGAGLKEAKDVVDALVNEMDVPVPKWVDEMELLSLLEQGQKISAIKLYRDRTGAGLKDSKDAVEALAEQHGILIPRSPGPVLFVVAVLLALVTAGVVAVLFR